MAIKRLSTPALEPVSLVEAKRHLRVSGTEDDDYITSLISVARRAAEDRTERTFITTTWKLTLDKFPESIILPMPPIIAISSVIYTNTSNQAVALSNTDWFLDADSEPGWLVPAVNKAWPETLGINSVAVTYTAGYGATANAVPTPIRQWILLAVGDMYDQFRSLSAEKPVVPQHFADALLDPYRFFGV
jgi:uncharacterized phiE125 gp8 family phage protein